MNRNLAFAVTSSNIYSWGENINGSSGAGRNGSITIPSTIKAISESSVRFCSMGIFNISGETHSSYANTAICIDGKLFGAGVNRNGEIDNTGVDKNTLTEISRDGVQWTQQIMIHSLYTLYYL